jgi:hypothetical protein
MSSRSIPVADAYLGRFGLTLGWQKLLHRKEGSNDLLRKERGQLQNEIGGLRDESVALQQDQTSLRNGTGTLQLDNAALHDEIDALRSAARSVAETEIETAQLRATHLKLQRDLEIKNREVEAIEQHEHGVRRDASENHFENENLGFENEKLHKKVSKLKRDVERLHDMLEEAPSPLPVRQLPNMSEVSDHSIDRTDVLFCDESHCSSVLQFLSHPCSSPHDSASATSHILYRLPLPTTQRSFSGCPIRERASA